MPQGLAGRSTSGLIATGSYNLVKMQSTFPTKMSFTIENGIATLRFAPFAMTAHIANEPVLRRMISWGGTEEQLNCGCGGRKEHRINSVPESGKPDQSGLKQAVKEFIRAAKDPLGMGLSFSRRRHPGRGRRSGRRSGASHNRGRIRRRAPPCAGAEPGL
jgi:hypothetical protein